MDIYLWSYNPTLPQQRNSEKRFLRMHWPKWGLGLSSPGRVEIVSRAEFLDVTYTFKVKMLRMAGRHFCCSKLQRKWRQTSSFQGTLPLSSDAAKKNSMYSQSMASKLNMTGLLKFFRQMLA